MKKVAIYVRVSTQEQATEGYSIQEQTERLKKYCEAHDWAVVYVYTDPGFSGSNMERPALKKLFTDADQGSFDTVLVYKLDRLSRSQKDTLYIIEDVFLKNGIDFISMNENFDTSTPFGRAMIGILSVFAQLEREQIKERLMMGRVGRAKTGLWNGGSRPPLGYNYENGRLVINEYEAMQVRLVYDLFLNGLDGEQLSFHAIMKYMGERYTNRYSCWKRPASIGLMLKDKIYIGQIKYAGIYYPGDHEAIISQEVFDAVQAKYANYTETFGKSQRTPFQGKNLLTGLLFCGYCGARFYMSESTRKRKSGKTVRYYHYRCYSKSGNKNMSRSEKCPSIGYQRDKLNQLVIDEICKLAMNPDEIILLQNKSMPSPDVNDTVVIQKRLAEIEKQTEKLLDLYQLGSIDISKVSERVDSLSAEKNSLLSDLENKKAPQPTVSVDEVLDIVSNAEEVFRNGTPEEQQSLVRALIKKIIIYKDHLEFHWFFCA